MQPNAMTHARLMRESTDRIELALRGEDPKEHLVAQRIVESPSTFGSWELEHSSLMRHVADSGTFRTQAGVLRQTALRLVHNKALFEYLRQGQIRGERRERIINHFYPTRAYEHAVLQEHATYLRKAGSFMCTGHIGNEVVADPTFLDPMRHYETLYTEYFNLYCTTLFPKHGLESASEAALLPLLKHQLNEWRWVILHPRASLPTVRRESEMRRPLGDTQRLPALKFDRG